MTTLRAVFGELQVSPDGETLIDEWGGEYPREYFDEVLGSPASRPYSYRDDVDIVHHDHWADHVTVVTVRDGRKLTHESRSGIFRARGDYSDEMLAVAEDLADGGPSREHAYSKVKAGWHSSMERSEQSDRINEIRNGALGIPVAVRLGSTRNVCSVAIGIYAPEEHHEAIDAYLNGSKAQPHYAGVD